MPITGGYQSGRLRSAKSFHIQPWSESHARLGYTRPRLKTKQNHTRLRRVSLQVSNSVTNSDSWSGQGQMTEVFEWVILLVAMTKCLRESNQGRGFVLIMCWRYFLPQWGRPFAHVWQWRKMTAHPRMALSFLPFFSSAWPWAQGMVPPMLAWAFCSQPQTHPAVWLAAGNENELQSFPTAKITRPRTQTRNVSCF